MLKAPLYIEGELFSYAAACSPLLPVTLSHQLLHSTLRSRLSSFAPTQSLYMSQYSLKVNKELEQRFCVTNLLLSDKFLQKKKIFVAYDRQKILTTSQFVRVRYLGSNLNWWLFPWFSIELYWRSRSGLQAVEDFTGAGELAGLLQDSWSCWSFSNVKLIPSKAAKHNITMFLTALP